jgi:hypothetical protein
VGDSHRGVQGSALEHLLTDALRQELAAIRAQTAKPFECASVYSTCAPKPKSSACFGRTHRGKFV